MWSSLSGSKSIQVFFIVCLCVLPLEIQISRREGWDPINQFNPTTSVCLSQARTWISNIICGGDFFCAQLRRDMIVRFVDIGGSDDHHCLIVLFIMLV